MSQALLNISPIIAIFILGYLLKRLKVLKLDDGEVLLKLLFYIVTPALVYTSTSRLVITPHLLAFPLIATIMMFVIYLLDLLTIRFIKIPRKTLGAYFAGTIIANTGVVLPFALAVYGIDAVARIAMWDFVSGIIAFTLVYSLVVKHGDQSPSTSYVVKKILISPPIWALALGLTANLTNFQTPEFVANLLENIGGAFSLLFMFALGIFFTPISTRPRLLVLGITTRMLGGLTVGLVLSHLFGLAGLDRVIAVACCSAPAALISLTFSKLENLDVEFSASLVSLSLLLGLILIPVLTVVLK